MNGIAVVNRQPDRGWKVLQSSITRILLAVLAIAAFAALLRLLFAAVHLKPQAAMGIPIALLTLAGTCGIYVALVRGIERRPATELGGHGASRELGFGLLIGAGLFSITMLILYGLGAAHLTGSGGWADVVPPLAAALTAAVLEEIVFRGILFRIIEERLGTWIALAFTAALFGALHGANPGATVVSSVAIALEAGVLLAAAYMYTRRLWLPIGMHAAWNFTEGGVFGAAVSGGREHGVLATRITGSDLVSGGQFGPEASIVAVIVCLAAGVTLIVLAYRRGYIVKPFWKRARDVSGTAQLATGD